MKSEVPKQFLDLHGEPIIIKTVRQFLSADQSIGLVVVLPKKHLSFWKALEKDYPFISSIKIAIGGPSRTASVKSGLRHIPDEGIVAVHDAVRPFVSPEVINNSYESAVRNGSGVAAVALKDSIRERVDEGKSIARDRDDFVIVQTPQTFQVKLLKESYEEVGGDFSDDATVFERSHHRVFLVEGSYSNIKITTPEDLRQ